METSVLRMRVKVGESKDLDKLQSCISTVQDVIHQYGGDVLNVYLNERSDLCVRSVTVSLTHFVVSQS